MLSIKVRPIFALAVLCFAFGAAAILAAEGTLQERVKGLVAEAKQVVAAISVEELDSLMNAGSGVIVVDVRAENEYDHGHIKGAILIPRGVLEFKALALLPDTMAVLAVYCRIDGRAAMAAKTLTDLGYKNVRYLEGGFKKWVESGCSIYNNHGELIVKAFEKKEIEPADSTK